MKKRWDEAAGRLLVSEERFDLPAQPFVSAALAVEKRGALGRVALKGRLEE